MVKKVYILLTIALLNQSLFSQKTCDTPKDEITIDLNSISKCAINKSKKGANTLSKGVTVKISPRRRRIVRKRNTASSANVINATSKLEKIKKSTSLVGDLDVSSKKIAEKIPFSYAEEKPKFSSCKDVTAIEESKCFKEKMLKHVNRNLKYPEKAYSNSIQGRVVVQFVINEEGDIQDIITRGPYKGKALENEAKRIIKKLPKLIPGKVNGIPAKIKFGFPINFKIPGRKPSNVKENIDNELTFTNAIQFTKVSNIPLFKSCKNKDTEEEKLKCFNSTMAKHVKKYFIYPEEAVKNKITGRVYAYFVIDKNGNITNIKTRTPKNGEILGKATVNIIKKLPKFIPGYDNGKNVDVKHVFPINFEL